MGFLASINLAAAAGANAISGTVDRVNQLVGSFQNIVQFFVPLGQVAVAAATVYYILRKAKAIPEKKIRRKK